MHGTSTKLYFSMFSIEFDALILLSCATTHKAGNLGWGMWLKTATPNNQIINSPESGPKQIPQSLLLLIADEGEGVRRRGKERGGSFIKMPFIFIITPEKVKWESRKSSTLILLWGGFFETWGGGY